MIQYWTKFEYCTFCSKQLRLQNTALKNTFLYPPKKAKSANGKTENNDVYHRDWGKKVVIEEIGELTIWTIALGESDYKSVKNHKQIFCFTC